ncbi:MAG TPA: SIMPL domain-containing protein [Candidatus Saccharimonadales bacterium]|nr:SIMPL domain-containing protein [Candidatus Saccharimonadales bacterium]
MKLNPKTELTVKTALFSAVFTLVLFSLANFFVNRSWNFFSTNNSKTQPFTVQGSGSATATPDQAQISFTVTKTAPKLEDAQNEANAATNSIVTDLQSAGIQKKDIQTGNYNSHPNYTESTSTISSMPIRPMPIPLPGNSTDIASYTVDENITITLHDISKASAAIDIATKGSAENIYGPSFTFSEQEQQTLSDQARTVAISNAKQKAEKMAGETGIRLGKILSVQETNTPFGIQPLMMNAKTESGASSGSAPTQINPGENTMTVNIVLSYEVR